jgi:pimeloyl-ACP methyl ester carboxylesterase
MWTSTKLLLAAAACACVASCRFGLDYAGDESGLTRESIPVASPPGCKLSYLISGDATKPRVIFIHGSPGLASMYASYLRELGGEAEVIAVDRLGFGESAQSGVVVSFEEQAAAIAPLLVERGGVKPIIVGHSLGGPIAARLAADHPDEIGGLVIVAGGLNPELEEPRWYNEIARWRIVEPFLAESLRVSNQEMWACREQVEQLDPLLERIKCPVVVIHGTDDALVPFESVEHSVRRFSNNPYLFVMVLIGESHKITKLRREEVRETVEELLTGLKDFVRAPP